jgi:prepilin-type N-terminal cleavage/methylation domain-containing protein
MASSKQCGFSLLEMMIVLSIGLIMAGITFLTLQPALKDVRMNQAYDMVLTQLRTAREKAIENRQQYIVCIGTAVCTGAPTPLGAPTAQSVQIFQWPLNTALTSAVQISTLDLPANVSFQVVTGIPTGAATVPDGFGGGTVALDLDQSVVPKLGSQVMFLPDGSAHDTSSNLNSGVMYMARTGELYSSRAISVFGASGRIRGWRLVNRSGTATWIQQ